MERLKANKASGGTAASANSGGDSGGAGVAQLWFGIISPRIGLELVAALEGRDYEEAKRSAAEAMEVVARAARDRKAAWAAARAAQAHHIGYGQTSPPDGGLGG